MQRLLISSALILAIAGVSLTQTAVAKNNRFVDSELAHKKTELVVPASKPSVLSSPFGNNRILQPRPVPLRVPPTKSASEGFASVAFRLSDLQASSLRSAFMHEGSTPSETARALSSLVSLWVQSTKLAPLEASQVVALIETLIKQLPRELGDTQRKIFIENALAFAEHGAGLDAIQKRLRKVVELVKAHPGKDAYDVQTLAGVSMALSAFSQVDREERTTNVVLPYPDRPHAAPENGSVASGLNAARPRKVLTEFE